MATPAASPTPGPSAGGTCAQRALASMTLPQRVGQLFLLGLPDNKLTAATVAAIGSYHVGSVWFTAQTAAGVPGIRAVATSVQALATRAATDGVPFFIAANQEGGRIQALSGPGFSRIPTALAQGALAPSTVRGDARTWGMQLLAAGVNLDFAPVAGVVPPGTDAENAPLGQLGREYGHEPATVASHVVAFLQGMAQAGVATTVKHFPGLGRVRANTDVASAVDDTVTIPDDPYLSPFRAAVAAGVPFVMVSLATYERIDPANLAVFSPTIIEGLLRGQLQFDGVVMSDDLGAAVAVAAIAPAERALRFIDAGGDMIVSKTLQPTIAMARALTSRAEADSGFRARIDAAALRVLTAKQSFGLLACGA